MTDLQIGLMAIGATVLGAVLAYNRWTTWRSEPRRSHPPADSASAAAPGDGAPAFDADDRVEPVLDGFALAPHHADVGDPLPAHAAERVASATERRALLDPLIDVHVTLTLDHPVTGEAVLAAMPRSRRIGSKPFYVEGLSAATHAWEQPRPGQHYTSLQAGVQLANRTGALNEIEFSEFIAKTQALADQMAAAVDFPDMMAEVARARELDQFASEHDAQLVFKVKASRAAWSAGYLVQHAGEAGFVPGAIPGRLVLPASDPAAGPVLALQFETQAALADDPEQSALLEFDLLLDVPQVARSEQPYQKLREAAHALAQLMEGRVTDERGYALSAETLDQVGEDLEDLYDQLEARDLAAGSLLARRLFS
ncbi:MAG: hypothetical protein RJA36_3275 [Pseudomonadota bacterium]|jgi:hypothetical protein